METFDAIVIGTGGMGTAAACHLARRGCRVLGLDRHPPAHDRGSSHGQTRLIRQAYFEHPDYVPLLQRASALWRDLEEATGRRLLVESGLVMAGSETSALIPGALRAADIHGLDLENLSSREAATRWPAFRFPEHDRVVYEPSGGYLLVEDCVRAHAEQAVAHGADLRFGVTVHDWRPAGGGITNGDVTSAGDIAPAGDMIVESDAGRFTAARLVLCPGPWAAGLVKLPSVRFVVLRKSLFWHAPPGQTGRAFDAGHFPCFAFDTPAGFFYGFPRLDDRGVKLAEHTGGLPVTDPLDIDRGIDPCEQARIDAWIAAHLPTLGHDCRHHTICLYTMSPDGHFLLGLHPDHPRVAIAAGFSGHGFKFASVVGEILADLATTGATARPSDFLAPARFAAPG